VAVERLSELVEVFAQQRGGALRVAARPVDEAPAHRLQVDGQLDEQTGRPADQVGAGAALGELGQVGQLPIEQLAHLPQRVTHRDAWPGADSGREGHRASMPPGGILVAPPPRRRLG
jgi:hypothetical protein